MKITRFTQSCLLIEEGQARILIDPSGEEKDNLAKFARIDAVFYTHEHGDHFEPELAKTFVEQGEAPVYANASTAKLIEASKTVVSDGQEFDIAGVKIKAIELPHSLMPDGSEGPQNTGYLLNNKFFHPGDGKELEDFQVDSLALPITGPDISPKDAFSFAKQVKARNAIAVHYDKLGAHPEVYAFFVNLFKFPFKFVVLEKGQSTEV